MQMACVCGNLWYGTKRNKTKGERKRKPEMGPDTVMRFFSELIDLAIALYSMFCRVSPVTIVFDDKHMLEVPSIVFEESFTRKDGIKSSSHVS